VRTVRTVESEFRRDRIDFKMLLQPVIDEEEQGVINNFLCTQEALIRFEKNHIGPERKRAISAKEFFMRHCLDTMGGHMSLN
jgi:hypothetical protein